MGGNQVENHTTSWSNLQDCKISSRVKIFDLAVGWVGGNQVENHTTSWSNLQDCKISSRVEIPKLDPSVATIHLQNDDKWLNFAFHFSDELVVSLPHSGPTWQF